jgi:hypothetical protein
MRCFTIIHGSVRRGIKPEVSKSGQVGLIFRDRRQETFLPLSKEWQNFFLEGDKKRGILSGGYLETLPILSADLGGGDKDEPLCLEKVSLWNGRYLDPWKDRDSRALVLVRPPWDGVTAYTSAAWHEKLEKGRVERDYYVLGVKSPGMELVHGEISKEGHAQAGGFLLMMDAGSSFRMAREVAGEPADFIFQWWMGQRASLRRLTPANWRGQREAA